MTRLLTLLAALSVLALPEPAAAQLTRAEQTMVRTVDAEQARTLAMLVRWVDQNSGSRNIAGNVAMGRMLRAELEPLGFAVEWVDKTAIGRAGHLIARKRGRAGGKRLLLIGHLDTVFEPDSPFQRWRQEGDVGHGPGSVDDKGGMAVMVAALRAMQAAGTLKNANITIVLTGDEEDAGRPLAIARRELIAEGKRADAALDFESLAVENGADMGSIARRSVAGWTLKVTAPSGHSAGALMPGVSAGAAFELARIIEAFRRELPEQHLTFNVGLAVAGTTASVDPNEIEGRASGKTNIIAGQAEARGDLRTLSLEQTERVRARMRDIVARSLTGAKAEISFEEDYYPPMAPTAGSRALLARLNLVNRDLGLPAMGELDPAKRGAGDIGFVARDVDGLVGLGAAGEGSHSERERVDIPSIWRQAKRAAILMSRLAAERR
ncbi:MAG TPA: M20/M25/M40 family metallo-hydrolase [Sphingomicrobium sp.]|nr:M20/M25/M40 family metallo-hydrolase [Sphingomicrobium sp.]